MIDIIYEYLEYLWITINTYPAIIQVAIYFIFFSSFLVLIFLLSIFLTRRKKKIIEKRIKKYQPKMIKFFNEILDSDKTLEKEEILSRFNDYFGDIKSPKNRIMIPSLEEVVDKKDSLVYSANYKNLILALGIIEILEKNIDSSNNEKRFKSIQSFSKLNLTISDSKILPHAYSKRPELYKEARASYVTISNNDPFKFFDEEYELNDWDQINLFHQFKQHHKNRLPNFGKWIKYSKNKSQILFFVKMITCFKQESSINSLLELLNHDDILVRAETISAIGQLKHKETEAKLIEMYDNEPFISQKQIIIALSRFKSKATLPFLKDAYDNVNNSELKKIIAEVIFLHNEEGKLLFENLKKEESGFNLLILEHIENPLIPSGIEKSTCDESLEINELKASNTQSTKEKVYGTTV